MLDEYYEIFPKRKDDIKFDITSRQDYKYNCIAWAGLYTDRWLWPPGGYTLDGVRYFWPEEVDANDDIETFIEMFKKLGYELCNDASNEETYRKVALYVDDYGHCTHAARQKRSGVWTSKLGREHDIEHGTPYTIESDAYGTVHSIMRKKIKS